MKKFLVLLFPILSFAQQIDKVDFIKCDASVLPNFETRIVDGVVSYDFKVLSPIDSIRIDAKNMEFSEVAINGKSVHFKNNKKELILFEGFKKGKNQLKFVYKATPKQTMYFTGIGDGQQIWTQGQGRFTSYWLPSFDNVNEKVIFNISVQYDNKFNAISNGLFVGGSGANYRTFVKNNFKMIKPMSSYLVMLAIGNFQNQTEISQSGIPLENYYKPIDADKYPYTYKDSKTIFDFLEKK